MDPKEEKVLQEVAPVVASPAPPEPPALTPQKARRNELCAQLVEASATDDLGRLKDILSQLTVTVSGDEKPFKPQEDDRTFDSRKAKELHAYSRAIENKEIKFVPPDVDYTKIV